MHRARGDNHGLCAHGHRKVAQARLDAGCDAAVDDHPADSAIHHHPGAPLRRILKVGDQRRLLRTAAASHAAVAAFLILRATTHVARQESVVPSQLLETADEHLVASRGSCVIGVDADPASDCLERAREFRALEVREAVLSSPLPPHRLRRRKAGRVIDHGAAAERRSLQYDQPQIARGEQAAGIIHRFERVPLLVGEIRLVAIPASLRYPPFSSTMTSFPAAASSAATTPPPAPEPTTTTSQLSSVSASMTTGRIGFGVAGGGPSGPGYPIARAAPGVV